jgi:hypothetical protein
MLKDSIMPIRVRLLFLLTVRQYSSDISVNFGEYVAASYSYVLISRRDSNDNMVLNLYDNIASGALYSTYYAPSACKNMSLSLSRDSLYAAVGCPYDGPGGLGLVYIFELPTFDKVKLWLVR